MGVVNILRLVNMYLKIHYLYSFHLSLIVFCAVVDSNDHGYQYVSNDVITPESSNPDVILKKLADLRDNYYLDDFVRSPEVVKHPGFSILARNDALVQSAMDRQGLTLDSLVGVAGQQIASR